jgi:GAF domain-containing protein
MDSTTLLLKLGTIATQTTSRTDSLQRIANVLRTTGDYRWVGLYDVDHATQTVTNIVYSGPGAPEYPTFSMMKGLTGGAIESKKTVNVGDVFVDPRYLTAFGTTESELIVPIFDTKGDNVIGTIDIESELRNAFNMDTQRLLEECAKVIAALWR